MECLRKSVIKKFSAFEIRHLQEWRASEQEIPAAVRSLRITQVKGAAGCE